MKPIYKSKTFWLNLIGLIILALETTQELHPEYISWTAIGLVVANGVLRLFTNEAIGWKVKG